MRFVSIRRCESMVSGRMASGVWPYGLWCLAVWPLASRAGFGTSPEPPSVCASVSSVRERVRGMRERVHEIRERVRERVIGIRPYGLLGVRPCGLWTLAVWRCLICARRPGSDYQVPEDQSTPPIPQVPQCPRLSRAWIIGGFTINPEVTSHGGRAVARAIVRSMDSARQGLGV